MNPSCTADVSVATAAGAQPKLRCRSGITALTANHGDVPASCASTITGSTRPGGVVVATGGGTWARIEVPDSGGDADDAPRPTFRKAGFPRRRPDRLGAVCRAGHGAACPRTGTLRGGAASRERAATTPKLHRTLVAGVRRMRLENKISVITGGTSGIGRRMVRALREEGATVFFSGRRVALGAEVARATGATFIEADVALRSGRRTHRRRGLRCRRSGRRARQQRRRRRARRAPGGPRPRRLRPHDRDPCARRPGPHQARQRGDARAPPGQHRQHRLGGRPSRRAIRCRSATASPRRR